MMKLEDLLKRADGLVSMGHSLVQSTKIVGSFPDYAMSVPSEKFGEFRSSVLSFLSRTFGEEHPYYKEFYSAAKATRGEDAKTGLGIIVAARNEIAGGWTHTAKGIVAAEIFSDFLEMAEYLLAEGYKDASAVMIGSVLEEHLRQVCDGSGIPTTTAKGSKTLPKKADLLNSELCKAGTYNMTQQKAITAWLDIRNNAAHGKYSEYNKEQVDSMLQGVKEFIGRVTV